MTAPDEAGGLDRLLRAFACAAAEPGLSGVLLFDVAPELVGPVTDLFAEAVARGTDGGAAPVVRLGAATREDDLWSRTRLRPAGGRIALDVRRGDLVETDPAAPPPAVVVPDLARLPLAGLRAAVGVLGADVAAVERHGVSARWRPRARWLAFCRQDDAGRVSPHLLDRFPLRLAPGALRLPAEPAAAWRASAEHRALARLSAPDARPAGPSLDDEAVARVAALAAGERRGIALGRIARALAALAGDPATTAAHVGEAARLIGLPAGAAPPAPDSTDPGQDRTRQALPPGDPPPATAPRHAGPGGQDRVTRLPAPDPEEPLGPFSDRGGPGGPAGPPYPEDEAEPLREFAPLRGAWRRTAGPAADRGPVTGVRQAADLRDLALVPTVIQAAMHRRLPGRTRSGGGLAVTAADLRCYARAAEPERMLVLLLDHTCRRGWEWPRALAPYLQWAYTARAGVAVVEVGRADAPDELQAGTFLARNVLDPRLAEALYRRPGRGTPLAHGLLLAGQLVRRAFQQQPTALAEAWFVVGTDGRGNVPLWASLTGRLDGSVGRRGVDDALAAAGQLGALGRMRLHTVVLDVGARPYAELPFALAEALGGTVVAGPGSREEADDAS